jgi:uncharacterized protein YndB with AHSA1/START domain
VKQIRRERVYPHPPSRVWLALTEPRIIASWLMPTEGFKPEVGCKFRFRTRPAPGFDGIVHCTVVEVERDRRLAYTWASGKGVKRPTLVRWTLAPEGTGTRLALGHSGFLGVGGFILRSMLAGGWGKKMEEFMDIVLQRLESVGDDAGRANDDPLTEH